MPEKPPPKHYPIITYLRGYAILAIIVFHHLETLTLPSPFNRLIYGGGTGVHLFIFLSGFGLYLSHQRRPLSYFSFLKKRVLKVYIPYIMIVSLAAFLSLFIPIYDNSLYAYLGHVALFKMFDESIVGSYGYPFWFISMIIQLYLFFPVLVFLKKKLANALFLILCLTLSLGWSAVVLQTGHTSLRVWNSFFLQYLWEFALGMVIAANIDTIEKKWRDWQRDRPLLLSLLVLFAGMITTPLYGFLALQGGELGRMFNDIPALIGFTAFALFLYSLRWGVLERALIFTGSLSFALYLVHDLVIKLLSYFFTPSFIVVTLSLTICYILAYFYNKALAGILRSRILG